MLENNLKPILGKSIAELKQEFAELNLPAYVAAQVAHWIYKKNTVQFSQMSNLAKPVRTLLETSFKISPFLNVQKLPSPEAEKYIFQLGNHLYVEAVAIREKDHSTLCVSSQCGCPVDCKFCLTGVAGFQKNLSVDEIIAQLLLVKADGHNISNIVFMGMGEPLLNLKNVLDAIRYFTDPEGFGMSKRKVTVSTSGYLQGLKTLLEQNIALNLAFSVGNPNPSKRVKIMPIEKRNPILAFAALLKQYLEQNNRQLTLEYTLLNGTNDGEEELRELANLATYLDAKVNLINLNPHPKIPFKPVPTEVMQRFRKGLLARGVTATVRYTKGQEIVAACGQLGESLLQAKH